jgi:hypothetical protein
MKVRQRKHQLKYKTLENHVKCTCCGKYYSAYFADDQGHGCASYIYLLHEINPGVEKKSYISSQYGSGYDTMQFNIVDNRVVQQRHIVANRSRKLREDEQRRCNDENLLICDSCIAKYIKKGWITEDKEYDAFALIDELSDFYQEYPELYFDIMKHANPSNCIQLIREEKAKMIE